MLRTHHALFSSLFFATAVASAAPGDLDATFGTGGKTYTNFSVANTFAEGRALLVQSDGKIVIVGDYYIGALTHMALTRYNADGSVDASFGSGGIVQAPVAGAEFLNAAALQSDGKIVVAGFTDTSDFIVARFTTAGALDTSFNTTGYNILEVSPVTSGFDRAMAVVIQSTGKIVAGGYSDSSGGTTGRDFSFARFNTNGTLDTTFGSSGKLLVPIAASTGQDQVRGMTVLSDDSIIAVGRAGSITGIIKLTANGALDSTFDSDGKQTLSIYGTSDSWRSVAVDANGKLVVAGTAYNATWAGGCNGASIIATARYNANGSLDTSFNGSGTNVFSIVESPTHGQATANNVMVQGDGKIILAAVADYDGGFGPNACLGEPAMAQGLEFAAARLNSNGTIDTGFATNGRFITSMGVNTSDNQMGAALDGSGRLVMTGYSYAGGVTNEATISTLRLTTAGALDASFDGDGKRNTMLQAGSNDGGKRIARQSDGKIVQVGTSVSDMAIARYNTNGTLDTSFSGDGLVTYSTGTPSDTETASAVAIQTDGMIVVVGQIAADLAVWRYTTAGVLDTSFDGDGIARVNFGGGPSAGTTATSVVIQGDGKIVVGGIFVNGTEDAVLLRFNANGSLDTGFDTDGKVQFSWGATFDEIADVALQSDGKIVVVGRYSAGTYFDAAAARFNTNGSFDTSFDGDGKATFNIQSGSDELYAVAMHTIGGSEKIVAAGKSNTASGTNDFLVLRIGANGSLDTGFGTSGYRVVNVSAANNDNAYTVAIRWDDKVVAMGPAFNGTNDDLAIVMLTSTGALDTSFDTDGVRTIPVAIRNDGIAGMLIQPDGKWVTGGGDDGTADFMVARHLHAPHEPRTLALSSASDSGASNSDRITKVTTPTFTGVCFPAETITLTINSVAASPTAVCSGGGTFSITVGTALTDGVKSVSAYATANGGTSSAAPAISVTIDTFVNAPVITTPAASARLLTTDPVLGNMLDSDATVAVIEGVTTIGTATPSGGNWSASVTLMTGPRTIFPRATDVAGNVADGAGVSFYAVVPTTTAIVADVNPSVYGANVTFTVTVSGGGPTPTGSVQLKDNGVDLGGLLSLSGGMAVYNASLPGGSHPLTAAYSGDDHHATSNAPNYAFVVNKADQSITFAGPADKIVSDPPFSVSASSTSGLSVSIASQTPSVCSIASNTVTLLTGGTCTLRATQAGDGNYNAASLVDRSFDVAKLDQSITFAQPPDTVYDAGSFMVSGSATSSLTVSIDSQTPAVCTVAAGVVTIVGAGACTLVASQAGDAIYNAALDVTRSVTIAPAMQTITFAAIPDHLVTDAPFAASGSATSSLTVAIASLTPSVCAYSLGLVTLLGGGVCTLRASQSGDANYVAAADVDRSFLVAKLMQSIAFGMLATKPAGDPPFAVTATSSSALTVDLTSLTPQTCSVSGTTVTLIATGICTVRASQGGDATYDAAPDVDQSFLIDGIDQAIAFTAPSNHTFGDATFVLSATTSSGLPVAFASDTPTVCTVAGDTVTIVGAGTCTLRASQAGDATYDPAPEVVVSFVVAKADQAIVVTAVGDVALSVGTFELSGMSSSGLAVGYESATPETCLVSGTTVTLLSAGTCTITASQAGDDDYAAASAISVSFMITASDAGSTGSVGMTGASGGESGSANGAAGNTGDEMGTNDSQGTGSPQGRGGCACSSGSENDLSGLVALIAVALMLRRRHRSPAAG